MALIEKEIRYLPELEEKIEKVFDKELVKHFPLLVLSNDEKHDLKQMLKFLLSTEEKDTFTKTFDINRVKKLLISSNSNERLKGELILQELKALKEKELADSIPAGMVISPAVVQLTLDISNSEPEFQRNIDYLWGILRSLDKIADDVSNVKKLMKQYLQCARHSSVSQSDEAIKALLNLLDSMKLKGNSSAYEYDIYIFTGDLEQKLRRVSQDTWQKLLQESKAKSVICFYTPLLPAKNLKLSQEPEKYVCKTLSEVLNVVKDERKQHNI